MKTVIKPVYYCDYCKKRGLSKHWMRVHEKHCTKNPERICRLCGEQNIKPLIEKYSNAYKIVNKTANIDFMDYDCEGIEWIKNISLKDIINDTGGCPNCVLTILRCNELTHPILFETFGEYYYKDEIKEWWKMKAREYVPQYGIDY